MPDQVKSDGTNMRKQSKCERIFGMNNSMILEIGSRVRIHTDRLKWADGKTAIITGRDDNGVIHCTYSVKIDDMDPSTPPFGLATFYRYEMEELHEPELESEPKQEEKDAVNHPSHYTDGKYECIDYMESCGYVNNGYLFNAVKYISRAGKKDPDKLDEDLDKAVWYLKRMLKYESEARKTTIPVDDYIQDKGLEGTARGMALKLIAHKDYELAIEMLTDFRDVRGNA